MKGNIKSFICGMLVMGVISGAVVFAADAWQSIKVLPNTIKVVVDGQEVQADNFLYNDTTYLPIRAVSEALKMDVQYDNATSTATISEKKEDDNMAVISKYTPPAEYINDEMYVRKKDGIYYVTLLFIDNTVGVVDYNMETKEFSVIKNGKEIYSNKINTFMEDGTSIIPYDQFVEEIEPLLK